jgi:hypothetical protein
VQELLEEGRIMGTREILVKVLELEEPLSAERRAEIEACSDLPTLDGWLRDFVNQRSRSEN